MGWFRGSLKRHPVWAAVAFLVVAALPWLGAVWPLVSQKALLEIIAEKLAGRRVSPQVLAMALAGIMSTIGLVLLIIVVSQTRRQAPQSTRQMVIGELIGRGAWLKKQLLESDSASVKEFSKAEHDWRTESITHVTTQVSSGKAHWVGDAVHVLDPAMAIVRAAHPGISEPKVPIVARIDRVIERLGSLCGPD